MPLEDIFELAHSRWIIERFYQDARGKRARAVGVSVGVRPRGPSVQLRGSSPRPNPPIGSWESLVDVVAGSSPVGGTRSYCIPNRAGESQFPSVSPPEPTTVYPRVCGGTRPKVRAISPVHGLSPRVRGNLHRLQLRQMHKRSIPACAGEPHTQAERNHVSEVYPRVCGGTGPAPISTSPHIGLSPRVRGNPDAHGPGRAMKRSIPACAGEPGPHRENRRWSWVYPRVCGGTVTYRESAGYMYGLSPRVRGNLK